MPLLCIKCDSRIERSLASPGTFWCPGCNKEIEIDETYRVGKRFFSRGIGAMLAMVAAMSAPSGVGEKPSSKETMSTYKEMKRQKRKKLKGLKMKQRRHERQMGRKK